MLLEQHDKPIHQSTTARRHWLRLSVVVLGLIVIWSMQIGAPTTPSLQVAVNDSQSTMNHSLMSHSRPIASQTVALATPQLDLLDSDLLQSPLSNTDQSKIEAITASEWLGPLAPIAVSPFFGITCLTALSQFGGDYLPANSFISNNAVLQNPYVLWLFGTLTLLTSLPRLTKVSKPFAQAMDMLETYGAIITIIILRFASTIPVSQPLDPIETAMVVQMGWMSFPVDVLFSLAAIVNIIVINSVKFFFEMLVWLVPFPFVDALLEIANKGICAGLMAVYAYNPLVATILNLVIFLACLYVFNWTTRRVTYWRTMVTDPMLALIWPGYSTWRGNRLNGFLQNNLEGIPAKASVAMEKTDSGWRLTQRRWFFPGRVVELPSSKYAFEVHSGIMTNSIRSQKASDIEQVELAISGRFKNHLDQISEEFGFRKAVTDPPKTVAMEL